MNANGSHLLTAKEIAAELKRHVSYVYAMKRQGFKMPGGRGTTAGALKWLDKHPHPRCGR